MIVRRFLVTSWAIALVLLVGIGSIQAQGVPAAMSIDSSFGVGYLLGWQMFHYIIGPEYGNIGRGRSSIVPQPLNEFPNLDPYGIYRTEFNPRAPVLSGSVEWSPLPFASGRVAGALTVGEAHSQFTRAMHDTFALNDPPPDFRATTWDAVPDFSSWEAAGLYHLYREGGYRFSLVGGYRQTDWTLLGTPTDATDVTLSLYNRCTSRIPFLALQTAMYFPWWKARFEVLGSPFMSKKVLSTVRGSTRRELEGWADRGGMIEFFMEGTAAIGPVLRVGLHARYTYEELYGWVTKRIEGHGEEYKLGFNSRDAILGLTLTMVF